MFCGHLNELPTYEENLYIIQLQKEQKLSKNQLVDNCFPKLLNNHNNPGKLAENFLTVKSPD